MIREDLQQQEKEDKDAAKKVCVSFFLFDISVFKPFFDVFIDLY